MFIQTDVDDAFKPLPHHFIQSSQHSMVLTGRTAKHVAQLRGPKEDLKRIRLLCAGSWQRSSMAPSRALQCACCMLSSAEPLKRAAPNKVSDSKSTHWNSENEG